MARSEDRNVVLFLCTKNSAQSQMAEAILRNHAADRFHACSAGLRPSTVHPLTHRVLGEIGIDTSGLRSKGAEEFLGKQTVHYAVVVCEKANQSCPRLYPFAPHVLYWPFEDPAASEGSEDARLNKFREVRDLIEAKILDWLGQQDQSTSSAASGQRRAARASD